MAHHPHSSNNEALTQPPDLLLTTLPRLPAEILADIIELAIRTASPCPLIPPSSASTPGEAPRSPFTTPLGVSYTSAWAWTGHLLHVSKFFYSIARPLLLQTLALDTNAAAKSFFSDQIDMSDTLDRVERAWFGNVSSLARDGLRVDPTGLRLSEAGWYEECSGGFVVGHAYASRPKLRRKRKGRSENGKDGANPKQYRSVSVYWAEEQLVEEVSDPERSSDSDSDDGYGSSEIDAEGDTVQETGPSDGYVGSLSLSSTGQTFASGGGATSRRRSHQDEGSIRDPRLDRPHEPAWQTLYSRQRRRSPVRTRGQVGATLASNAQPEMGSVSQIGPSEGDLDPWDMQDAQERLAAIANSSVQTKEPDLTEANADTELGQPCSSNSPADDSIADRSAMQHRRRRREIYAYHLCTATLEPWINPLLSSIRSLQLITITFYPGHLLDDDKLEHMLRRILSPSECPRLQTLLIRIVFDAASAGSRLRRFERTKAIAGAVDRIGDERVRVMLVNNRVGEGELVALPSKEMGEGREEDAVSVSPLSRKAITLTNEGWWSRVLQQNHLPQTQGQIVDEREGGLEAKGDGVEQTERQERLVSDWQMFFPPEQHGNPTHLVNLICHSDPWPDHRNPVR
ncbi:hypothetical protein NDA17_006970 [Ustilago hordei]|nr:hypothetical protein NDA17_006970 [Ustilago hordei]